ncbi:MAG: triose-phosphate isomerase [Nanoarchaeota archaeon]|nr:triose-phosphate isomerase [Nanoarchaeota archaeon]
MIIINFKNYKTGKEALILSKKIEKYLPHAIIAVPTIDLEEISKNTKLKVFAQHADPLEGDKTTGYNTLKSLKKTGISGTIINHSEHQESLKNIGKILIMAKKLNLKVIICTPTLRKTKSILNNKNKPFAIALEDPKLISTGKSITKYSPKNLLAFTKIIKKTNILPICGAGISTSEDVKQAYSFGCKGVLIASAIANSKNPIPLLKELNKLK